MTECRVYLPAQSDYHQPGPSSEDILNRYISKEFPGADSNNENTSVFSVPKIFSSGKMEPQAAQSERIVFQRLQQLQIPGVWCMFFHGRSYGGLSYRKEKNGKLMIREHDFVVFVTWQKKRYLLFMEVKSTCDDVKSNLKLSDAKMVKNNKRSAQHQLRDHLEVIHHELLKGEMMSTGTQYACQDSCKSIQSYICWPFLSSNTVDPQRQEMQRWKDDGKIHLFADKLRRQNTFNEWFHLTVLQSTWLSSQAWTALLHRFIMLSCGVFLEEMNEGLMALLTQEQLSALHLPPFSCGRPLIIHGAAGTGKTLLIIQKLKLLYECGELHDRARALYICYWPGIRCDVVQRLEKLGISEFVDTARFYIAMDSFLHGNTKSYKHVFMDESEAICLAFSEQIIQSTFAAIERVREAGGCLWYAVDIHQAAIFLPKHSPNLLKKADVVLKKVMRSTRNIFQLFQSYYNDPFPCLPSAIKQSAYTCIDNIEIGHDILGPPIYWARSGHESSLSVAAKVVIDLCSTKGVQPNDICVLPFVITDQFLKHNVNDEIGKYFAANGFMPQAMCNVESFITSREPCNFIIPWVLRAKGLEFKIVVLVIEDDDLDFDDPEDRRKLYIMSSRCTCMLIVISSESVKETIDLDHTILVYPQTVCLP